MDSCLHLCGGCGALVLCVQVKLSAALRKFIAGSTRSYGKVKLVLKHNRFWVETADAKVCVVAVSTAYLHALSGVGATGVPHHCTLDPCVRPLQAMPSTRIPVADVAKPLPSPSLSMKWPSAARPVGCVQVLEKLLHNPVIAAARAWDTPGADARGLVRRAAVKEHAAARLAKLTLAAATEGADAGAAAQAADGSSKEPAAAAAAAPAAAPAPLSAHPGAAVAPPAQLPSVFGDSESESDPEDFTGVTRRQPAPAQAAAGTAGQAAGAQSSGQAPAPAAAGQSDDDDDDGELVQVARAVPRAAPEPGAAPAADAAAAAGVAAGAAASAPPAAQGAAATAAADSDDDSDGLPVVGGRRRRQLAAAAAAAPAAAGADDASDMSEIDEADLEAAAQQEEEDPMHTDAGQQPQPARRGRLAATAAVAAATGAATGDGTAQALAGLQDGGGYEEVEEEEDPEREVLAFEIKASDVGACALPAG